MRAGRPSLLNQRPAFSPGERQKKQYQPEAQARADGIPRLRFGLVCFLLGLATAASGCDQLEPYRQGVISNYNKELRQLAEDDNRKEMAPDCESGPNRHVCDGKHRGCGEPGQSLAVVVTYQFDNLVSTGAVERRLARPALKKWVTSIDSRSQATHRQSPFALPLESIRSALLSAGRPGF